MERWVMHLHMLLACQSKQHDFDNPSSQCYKRSSTFGLRYHSIFQNSIQEETFAVGFVTIWWCYVEGLREGGAQHQRNYHVNLWSIEWVGCTNSHELLEDGTYITSNMECWFCPSWWKGEELDKLGALIPKLRLGDDEMSMETYI
jgi:hypothetical protein